MDLEWLEDFLALVDAGHFGRAAEHRHLTQPAFSRRVKALEDWAGAALFDRSTHRVGLTAAGEALRPSAEEIVRRLLQSREEVRRAAGTAAAALRFAATHALSLTFFPTWLRTLESQARSAAIHLMSDSLKACEQAMRQGQAQFLLCHAHPAVPAHLDPRHFLSAAVGGDVLVPAAAADGHGAPLHSLSPLADRPVPVLDYSPDSALGWIVGATVAGAPASLRTETMLTARSAMVLRAMALNGRGIAWLPLSLIEPDLRAGTLARAGSSDWDAPVEIRLFRSKARQSPEAERFWTLATRSPNGQP